MNKLFRFTAAALLVASFGVLGNYYKNGVL